MSIQWGVTIYIYEQTTNTVHRNIKIIQIYSNTGRYKTHRNVNKIQMYRTAMSITLSNVKIYKYPVMRTLSIQ